VGNPQLVVNDQKHAWAIDITTSVGFI